MAHLYGAATVPCDALAEQGARSHIALLTVAVVHARTTGRDEGCIVAVIALVTCEEPPVGIALDDVARVDAPLASALRDRGVTVAAPSWRATDVDWDACDMAVVRTVWDYIDARDEFVAWADEVGQITDLWNRPEVLRWNTHKSYLLELEDRGAPVIPTAWTAQGDRIDLWRLMTTRGWGEVVIKPAVASGSLRLLRAGGGDVTMAQRHLDQLLVTDDVMIQPYLPAIATRGEVSVVVIDGIVSHVVRKRAAAGDFRVQSEYGGVYEPLDDADEASRLAEWIVEATGHPLLVARVDLVEDATGQLQLIELEATEPDLFLNLVPAAADLLADAMVERLASPPGGSA
ncbi:MAG: hypothetical protein WD358_01395 [Nitriliruptoraceae bacterium]